MAYENIPPATLEALITYRDEGRYGSGFLDAVLTNNLKESFARADLGNRDAMFEIVTWLYNEMPTVAWGTVSRVNDWVGLTNMKKQGLSR